MIVGSPWDQRCNDAVAGYGCAFVGPTSGSTGGLLGLQGTLSTSGADGANGARDKLLLQI